MANRPADRREPRPEDERPGTHVEELLGHLAGGRVRIAAERTVAVDVTALLEAGGNGRGERSPGRDRIARGAGDAIGATSGAGHDRAAHELRRLHAARSSP